MSEKLSKFIDDKSLSRLYLYMIIFILSYHIDDWACFVSNYEKKLRIIGISERYLRVNQQSLSSISL